MTPRFDPTRAVVFDLARGELRDDEGASRLNLPVAQLARLLAGAGESEARDFGFNVGAEAGRRIADRFGSEKESASIEAWTEHLGGHLALLGLGQLRCERWGRALIFRVANVPRGLEDFVGFVLEGALQRGLSRDASLVGFSDDDSVAYLCLSSARANVARTLRSEGQGLGRTIESLHASRESQVIA